MALFGWLGSGQTPELPDIYPVPIAQGAFVSIDVKNIYTRILMDVLERTDGIPEDKKNLLWDNCVANESQDGVVTLLAKAMVDKADLFLVFDKTVKVIRKATSEEQQKIRDDYKKSAESKTGIFITFKNYDRTDMVKFYSALEYCSVGGLYKSSNLSKAIQIKISDLRASVGLADSGDAKKQAVIVAEALKAGRDVMIDAKDIIETAKPDLTAVNSSMDFIASKQSFYLGLPSSWITGSQSKTMGDSGKSDSKSVERGLKPYYFSIIKPVIDMLFDVKTTFKSEDFEMLTTANETLKTFDVTSNDHLSAENKTKIVNKIYGLPEDEEGDEPEPQPDPTLVPPGTPAIPAKPAPPPQ